MGLDNPVNKEELTSTDDSTLRSGGRFANPLYAIREFVKKPFFLYLIKAIILLCSLYLLSEFVSVMPPIIVAIIWASLSAAAAIGFAYYAVVKKTHKQFMYKEGGRLSRFNEGRSFRLVVAFISAALLMASLIFEMPKWELSEWLMIVGAVGVFYIIMLGVKRIVSREYEQFFCTSKAVFISGVVVAVLLCLVYMLVLFFEPPVTFATATEAFLATPQPFEGSSSALLVEMGRLQSLVDGLTNYGLSQAAEISFIGYIIWRIVLVVSAFFGFSSLLAICALETKEFKRVFLPLESAKVATVNAGQGFIKKYAAIACALPVCFMACFLVSDAAAARAMQTGEFGAVESFVQEQVGMAAYVIDGRYYDQQAIDKLLVEASQKSANLSQEAEEVLTPLINDAFDKRLENVDAYLDWYYSLPADYERLAQFFTGTVEEGMKDQLQNRINDGVDDSALVEQFENYLNQASALQSELQEELSAYELSDVPDWLIVKQDELSIDAVSSALEPTQKLLDGGQRMGLSAGLGVAGGIITKKVTEKVLAKPFFNKIVTRLVEALGTRGLLEAAGTTGGTVLAPGVGTAVGLVGSIAVGTVSDYLFLKADEAMNRESYKEEITSAIEDGRSEMLAMVQGI